MLPSSAVIKALAQDVVPVMWKYDGLGGKAIAWTKQHGNTNDDPSHLIWLLDEDGAEIARAGGEGETSASLVEWLASSIATWEKRRAPGIARRFEAPADGVDVGVAGARARMIWYAATDAEGAAPERRSAAERTASLALKVLSSKKLEGLTENVDLVRVDGSVAADGTAADAATLARLPRIVILGPSTGGASEPYRAELTGAVLTVDALTAALGKLPKPASK